jgi:tRNA (guanine37-N1)-methyltransferase
MLFKIFTLHPDIFESFTRNSLIARGLAKNIIKFEFLNWREKYGIGNYKQVDDSPFGGGSGMVLMAEPIIKAMEDSSCFDDSGISKLDVNAQSDCHPELVSGSPTIEDVVGKKLGSEIDRHSRLDRESPTIEEVHEKNNDHTSFLPNNAKFYEEIKTGQNKTNKVNIMMTPRGFPMNQKVVEWLAEDFDEINILCGRYEGFDARVNDFVDLELSIGNFVLNGGEVGAMCLAEAVSRLVPDFISKNNSVLHDSFSSGLNEYKEFQFDNAKTQYKKSIVAAASVSPFSKVATTPTLSLELSNNNLQNTENLFDNNWWKSNILPYIEHPQYTRPEIWRNVSVPAILKTGDHAKIQKWRTKWY